MKVYIISGTLPYEGGEPIECFTTRKGAEDRIKDIRAMSAFERGRLGYDSYSDYEITMLEVQQ